MYIYIYDKYSSCRTRPVTISWSYYLGGPCLEKALSRGFPASTFLQKVSQIYVYICVYINVCIIPKGPP